MFGRTTAATLAVLVFSLTVEVGVIEAAEAEDYRAVLDRYCVGCHNDRLQTAGVSLDDLDVAHVATGAETWEKVVRKLRAREMPPPRRPRPDEET
ncbi:MAG TPA: hypothetical protein EYO94_06455, partial [Acidobacteria bacterium]|nr:hypothetical protein [Acidobacteriota bacterium]